MTIRIWPMFLEVMEYCWRDRRAMVRFGLIPFLVEAAVLAWAAQLRAGEPSRSAVIMAGLATVLTQLVIYLPMTVSWYRMVVIDHDEGLRRPAFTLGRAEGRLLLWQIAVGLMCSIAGIIGIAIVGVIFTVLKMLGRAVALAGLAAGCIVLGLALLVLLNRLSFVVVLAATGQPVHIKAAWRLTTGVSWPISWVFVLICLAGLLAAAAWQLVALLVGMIGAMATGTTASVIVIPLAAVGQAAIGVPVFLANATLFGLVYRRLVETQVAAELASQPVFESVP